jgi:hypothetical protein
MYRKRRVEKLTDFKTNRGDMNKSRDSKPSPAWGK